MRDHIRLTTGIFFFLVLGGAAFAASDTELEEIEARIMRFHEHPEDGSLMNRVPPKYDAVSGQAIHPNALLQLGTSTADPLLSAAQRKADPVFQQQYCESVLKKQFPELHCDLPADARATYEANDTVESLTSTWVPNEEIVYDLSSIPTHGYVQQPIWSDDFWRAKYGQIAYRYAKRPAFKTYREAVGAYSQPSDWNNLKYFFDPYQIESQIVMWSPAEKYDLTLGDEIFSLTANQKGIGKEYLTPKGEIEEWMGLCHGWAAASIMLPPPLHSVRMLGARRVPVTWYPNDIKALLTMQWASSSVENDFTGGRCNTKKPMTYPNGRLVQQECFDTNPATFHLALGNMIGLHGLPFLIDSTFDYEVWNQPMKSYDVTYYNPLAPSKKSKNWKDVAVDYDARFKRTDRFQSPLTRGVRFDSGLPTIWPLAWNDKSVQMIVGVTNTVLYLMESIPPKHTPVRTVDYAARVTYTYDLELSYRDGELVPTGGEWHENTHPDFLWIPKRTTYPHSKYDDKPVYLSGNYPPRRETTRAAQQASAAGFPLCAAVKTLLGLSTGKDSVRCPSRGHDD